MQQQESIQAKKRWDVAEVPVKLDPGCTWGVPARHVPVILEKLLELGLIEKTDVVPGKLKLNQFRILIAHLHQNGYKTDELPAALDQWLNEGKEEEPAAKNENKKNIEFDQQPKGVLFEQFKSTVEELYSRKKVLVEDDLQKYRWGGNARENGKRLYGEVRKSKIPGLYNVILSVSSTDKTEFKGLVAFFLHNSFKNEIEYAAAIKGVAKIEITAYEAFTAAAYTEDGTMLELDLNEISRLAKGFYYNSVSDKFKEAAESLGNSKPITVKDDPQKDRWGGLSINNGKQVTATVKSSIMPGYFNVCIEVLSTDAENPFMGDVAFFLHPTFRNRIKYRKSTDGKAKLNLTAYEAFTIGAYLHDGTMLELDLQQVKGYPEGFYYKE